jgi:hypothetical protein
MSRCLYRPRGAKVSVGADDAPSAVGRHGVEAIREHWLVEDRFWTARPLRRRYFEVVLADGSDVVVFCDLDTGRWFTQTGA